jgi:ABC-type branched-subunit amino acid transport system substrate-binding protein
VGDRPFPPGLGQVALIAGLVIALLVSVVAAMPHYTTTKLSQTSGSGSYSAAGPVNGAVPGGAGPAGSPIAGNAGPAPGGAVNSAGGGSSSGGHYVSGHGGYTVGGSGGTLGMVQGPTGSGRGSVDCTHGRNGGATAPGVSASTINVASTIVTSGVGSGFLGQAQDGIEAAFRQQNNAGGVCGRQISFQSVNSGWDGPQGAADISSYIHSGSVFALVGQPDSEGLDQATTSGLIDSSGMPVVGTDGLLKSQYGDQWIWPVAAPTVVNMHIIASYAYSHFGATSASDYGIVYDSYYKFGAEGAAAFDAEVHRLTGGNIPGYSGQAGCSPANQQYCGFDGQNAPTSEDINAFTAACNSKCKVVVMLLEPTPMEEWMGNVSGHSWYQHLFGGEPLFDDNLGGQCGGCANMIVWTGYHPAVQPFDSESAVAGYVNALHAVCPSCDAHNEFTEGAYIGAQLFIAALKVVAAQNEPLTRANLRAALDALTFNDGLTSSQLGYSSALHLANTKMAAFSDNYSGTFNGWTYLNTGFVADPAAGQDL